MINIIIKNELKQYFTLKWMVSTFINPCVSEGAEGVKTGLSLESEGV